MPAPEQDNRATTPAPAVGRIDAARADREQPTDVSTLDARIYADLVGAFYQDTRFWISNAVLPLIVIAATYGTSLWPWSVAWGLVHVAIYACRLRLVRIYLRTAPPPADARRWMQYGYVSVLVTAITWGAASLAFVLPDVHHLHWLLGLVLLGLVSGAAVTAAAILPYFYTLVTVTMTPYFLGLMITQTDRVAYAAGAVVLVYTVTRVHAAKLYHQRLVEIFRLRYENLDLIDKLRQETREAEAARERADAARERAEEANLAKSRYLAAASHDLRQPVHALGLFMEDLREQSATGAAAPPHLVDNIDSAVESLGDLLGAVLDISKLDSGMVKPNISTFCIGDILERVITHHSGAAKAKGVTLRHVRCRQSVRSDPALLMRIVGNFVSNAVRYTARGSVLVGCRRTRTGVRIEVWDTGRGIPASEHAAIFHEFHRLEDTHHDGGLGLGLAIAQRTAALLGHPLTMQSVPGRGSVFRIAVPCGDATLRPDTLAAQAEQFALNGIVVAVVDDEPAILAAMSGVLGRWGCRVIAARSGAELLAALRHQASVPDAMLVDYQLANGELGPHVIERLQRELGVHVPSHLITGNLMREQLDAFETAGLHVLHKPVRPEQLRQCLIGMLCRAVP